MSTEKWKNGFKECPDCGGSKFLEGPHGGLSVNFKCAGCGSEFNNMGPFGIERIGEAKAIRTCRVCGCTQDHAPVNFYYHHKVK